MIFYYYYLRATVAQSVKSSAPDRRARVRDSPGENCHVRLWQFSLVHVKSVVDAMSSKFLSKLYLWGYQSGGAISSGANQNCDGMSRIRDESQTVRNSPLAQLQSDVKPTQLSTIMIFEYYKIDPFFTTIFSRFSFKKT